MRNGLSAYNGRRVWVSGHTGFKGAWLTQWLLELGAQVSGFSVDLPSNPCLFSALDLASSMRDRRGEIRDKVQVMSDLRDFEPEIVFHLAAQPLVRKSYDEPLETFEINLMGTLNVLEAVRRTPSVQAVVVVTTDKCYENLGLQTAFTEKDPLGGKDPYSASKACAEIATHAYLRSFFKNGARVATVRAGNVIGGGDWAEDRLVPDCVRAWSQGKKTIIRNPEAVRPWQHVLEPVGAYLQIGERLLYGAKAINAEAFNIGPSLDGCITVEELLRKMASHWPGVGWEVEPATDQKEEATTLKLNTDKARERLGWKGILNIQETLEWTVDWYRAFYQNPATISELTKRQTADYSARLVF